MVDSRLSFRRCTFPMLVNGRLSVFASRDLYGVDGGFGWIPVSYCDLVVCTALIQKDRGYFLVKKAMG